MGVMDGILTGSRAWSTFKTMIKEKKYIYIIHGDWSGLSIPKTAGLINVLSL